MMEEGMTTIYLWGENAQRLKEKLRKEFKMKWSKKQKRFYREKCDSRLLKRIMNYCLKNAINYKTDDGRSYEVIQSEVIETSSRELKDWVSDDESRGPSYVEEIDYEQMWDEYKEEE